MKEKICPVDVISMCAASGEICPLRLRMEDEVHQLMRIDIDEVVSVKKVEYVGIEAFVFLCRGIIYGKSALFELRYTIRTHSWCWLRRVC